MLLGMPSVESEHFIVMLRTVQLGRVLAHDPSLGLSLGVGHDEESEVVCHDQRPLPVGRPDRTHFKGLGGEVRGDTHSIDDASLDDDGALAFVSHD